MNGSLTDLPAVAVIGMAGRFPGASNVREFWDNLRGGVESISVFSEEEMIEAGVDPGAVRASNYVPSRGLAPDLDLFDAAFFGYTPREAELMDPQHRAFLECAWEALEDAGIDSDRYGGAIGVYAGTSISTYLINNVAPRMGGLGAGAIQAALANDKDHVPTRVSYKLNLRGPSVNVQTACSTSLVATHIACQSLLSGECDVALAGGVSVTVPLRAGYHYEEGSILAPDGHCRAFDAASDGTVGGSGVAAVVLKLLEHAIADGDPIHAVIRGSAINNDGSFKVGYTAPSVEGQAEVIAQAHGMAEVNPETITYIETHGTATPLGDPIEIAALTRAFREHTDRSGFCAIGSVKTNIGHMDAAAGVVGLIKTVLALEHGEIPPSLHFTSPNPEIGIESTPFYVNAKLSPWETNGDDPRRAGVSSFGIGGTNAHVVLEQAPAAKPGSASRAHQLLTLSARTDVALADSARRMADHLELTTHVSLADMAYTLHTGRRGFARRWSTTVSDREGAIAALRELSSATRHGGDVVPDRPVLFMFPGQGSQHVGMGRLLYESEPTFKRHLDECSDVLEPLLGADVREVIYPKEGGVAEATRRLTDTRFAQPAIFAIQYSLAQLWMEWGVRPQGMIGHSIGEYAAACLGGVFDVADALHLVAARGRLMAEQPPGSMLAAPLPPDEVGEFLQKGVSLAAVNQVGLSVLSGPTDAIDEVAAVLKERGLDARRLHTSHAFHSSMMDSALAPFEAEVAKVGLRAPTIPFVSCVTGHVIRDEDAIDPHYWARHLREPVLFAQGLDALLDGFPDGVLVETGSSQTLSALSRRHASGAAVVPTLPHARSGDDDAMTAVRALGAVWESGVAIDWAGFYGRESRRKVSLPTYPFQRHRYWIDAPQGGWSADRIEEVGKRSDVDDWFYVPTWRQSVGGPSSPSEMPHRWLVFGSEVGAAARVTDFAKGRGCEVVTVGVGSEFGEEADGRFLVDPNDPDHYVALLDALDASDRSPDVMLHAWTAGPRPQQVEGSEAEAVVSDELDRGVHSLIALGRALAGRGGSGSLRVCALTTGAVDLSGDLPPLPSRSAALAALKVVAQELPGVTAIGVDVDEAAGDRWREGDVARVVADLSAPATPGVVAYRGRRRFIEAYERARIEPDGDPSVLRDQGVYLILGGLGGVGLEVAGHLYRLCGARLALTTTRSVRRGPKGGWLEEEGPRDSALAEVGALQDAGAEVLLIRSDVADAEQLEAAFVGAENAFGVVHGVIFAVGVAKEPTPLSSTDRGEIDAQLDTRIHGLRNLGIAVGSRGLDFCLVQSSLASVLGAAGFVGYTAAHGFMDAFAADRDRAGDVPWIVVDWDNWITWKDAGSGIEGLAEFYMSREEGGRAVANALRLGRRHQRLVVSTGSLDQRIKRWINPPSDPEAESNAGRSGGSRYARPETSTLYEAPSTDAERALAQIWGDILGIEPVGIRDDFFELGGDSVLGIQVVARARGVGLRLSAQEIFEYPTIAQMAEVSGRSMAVEEDQGPVTGPVPLTPIQCWFFERDFPAPHHFNMPVVLEAPEVDAARLAEAISRIVAHHDALRTRFESSDGDRWTQHVGDVESPVDIAVVDLSRTLPEGLSDELAQTAATLQASLDLSAGPLFRPVVIRTAQSIPDRILLIAHHLVVDAVSWRVLLEDLNSTYRQLGLGEKVELPPKTASFKKWAAALQPYAASSTIASEEALWGDIVTRVVPALPRDLETGPNSMASLATVAASLDEEHTRALLQDVPKALRTKIDEVLLAALTATLTAWTGERTLRVALEGHGREDIESEVDLSRTVGWFTSLFPVVLDVARVGSSEAALRAVKEDYRRIPRGGIGYGVLRYLRDGPSGVFAGASDPDVSLLYLGRYQEDVHGTQPFRVLSEPAGPACDTSLERPHLFDFLVSVVGRRLELEVGYSTNCHDRETAERLATGFIDHLKELVARAEDPGAPVVVASDFPDSGLTQEQLDALMRGMGDERE